MCKKVRDLVYSDRRIQVEEIAQALGISHGSVSTILSDRLVMKPGPDAHWMPPTKKCVRKFGIWFILIGEFKWKK